MDERSHCLLKGDHLYRMDYMDFVQKHVDSGVRSTALPCAWLSRAELLFSCTSQADITVSAVPMDDSRASDFGLMKVRLVSFVFGLLVLRLTSSSRLQIDATGRIIGFAEKPKGEALKAWAVDTTILGLTKEQARRGLTQRHTISF